MSVRNLMRKELVHVVAFLCCLSCNSRTTSVQSPQPAASSSQAPSAAQSNVSFEAKEVTANYSQKVITVEGTLRFNREQGTMKPGSVWLWGYFYSPDSSSLGSWSDKAVELNMPFTNADEAWITAKLPCHWCGDSYAPKSNLYTRLSASSVSEDSARVPAASRDKSSTTGATLVRIVR